MNVRFGIRIMSESRGLRWYLSALEQQTHYERLELSRDASIKEVKKQFKVLSKKYHPDLNSHLTEEEKVLNNDRFVLIVSSYDILKDAKKKRQYDLELNGGRPINHSSARKNLEWHNKYYGEAKYYSKANGSSSYSGSGLNRDRHKSKNFGSDHLNNSTFSGRHVNYGDRFDVPHFNYKEHLTKHLKFEQRLLNKNLSASDVEKIIKQLNKSGDQSQVDEELLTKHLMRQAKRNQENANNPHTQSFASRNSSSSSSSTNQHMYHGPQLTDNDNTVFKACAILGAGSSLYFIWHLF